MPVVLSLVGCLALVALTTVRPQSSPRVKHFFLAVLAVFVGGMIVVDTAVDNPTHAVKLRQSALYMREEAIRLRADPPAILIIVEGGSHASRSVSPEMITAPLRERGLDVRCINIALAGANHFEREHTYDILFDVFVREYLDYVDESHSLVLMRELSVTYETRPLEQFDQNPRSDRTLAYLRAPVAIRAAVAAGTQDRLSVSRSLALALSVFRRNLGTGAFSLQPSFDKLGSAGGYRPIDRVITDYIAGQSVAALEPRDTPEVNVSWLAQIDAGWRTRLHTHRPKTIWFTPPTLRQSATSYAVRRSTQITDPVVLPTAALGRDLDAKEFWIDTGHMSIRGAEVYSQWLSNELAQHIGRGR